MNKPVRTRVVKPTINRMARWTQAEIQFLRQMAGSAAPADIGKALGRSERAVINKAHVLGISLAYAINRTSNVRLAMMVADILRYKSKKAVAEAYGMEPGSFYELLSRRVHKAGVK